LLTNRLRRQGYADQEADSAIVLVISCVLKIKHRHPAAKNNRIPVTMGTFLSFLLK